MRYIFVIVGLATIAVASSRAQDSTIASLQKLDARVFAPDSADAKLRWDSVTQLRNAVNKRDVETWRTIKSKADWEKLRDDRITSLKHSLGAFGDAPKVNAITTKKHQGDGFTVECVLFETRPNFFVTANLYAPKDVSKPMPGFLIVHSHHNPKTERELQDMGILWAKQGCTVLVPDMLGHGERRQHPFTDAKTYPEAFKVGRQDYYFRYNVNLQLQLVGDSLMGWMVWDLMRAVDLLVARPNIDKSKIMVFGSVAGGGDPCAVLAAVDPRIQASAPFNFGGPQPETSVFKDDPELSFNYMGGGSWESTRGLRLGARDGFLPWIIVGSIAPRGLVYSHEFAWDEPRDPVWARYNKIWGDFYGAKDKLASSKGRGSVKGKAPESTHCNNIGFDHRKPIYPTLTKWFGLPIPEEPKARFESSELRCWTDEAKKTLKPKVVHEILRHQQFRVEPAHLTDRWLDLLGIVEQSKGADLLRNPTKAVCQIERVKNDGPAPPKLNFHAERIIITHPNDPSLRVPALLLRPQGKIAVHHVVIGLAQDGKAGFLQNRAETIADLLLKYKVAVCLPDLRGTGETANDGRNRTSGATSYSASLQRHGLTVPGVQLQELAAVMNALPSRGFKTVSLWADSFAEPNDPGINFAVPYEVGKTPRQSEPMAGLLALLGGVFGGDNVKAVYVRGGLVSFRSMLDSPFCYFPHEASIPGALRHGDIDTLAAGNAKRSLRLEALVDGLNRRVDDATLKAAYKSVMFTRPAHDMMVLRSEPGTPSDVANFLMSRSGK